MVTGASGMIGRALVPLLIRNDEVRACVRRPEAAPALRAMGAKVAVGHLDDADALAEILKRVFTVIHLVGGPTQVDDDAVLAANHGSVITALAASRRLVSAGSCCCPQRVQRSTRRTATSGRRGSPKRRWRTAGWSTRSSARRTPTAGWIVARRHGRGSDGIATVRDRRRGAVGGSGRSPAMWRRSWRRPTTRGRPRGHLGVRGSRRRDDGRPRRAPLCPGRPTTDAGDTG